MLSPQELPKQLAITLLIAAQDYTPTAIDEAVAKTAILVPGLNQQALAEEMAAHFQEVASAGKAE